MHPGLLGLGHQRDKPFGIVVQQGQSADAGQQADREGFSRIDVPVLLRLLRVLPPEEGEKPRLERIAVGIGIAVGMFSVLYGVVLQALPYPAGYMRPGYPRDSACICLFDLVLLNSGC
jgi:hypothetical protein